MTSDQKGILWIGIIIVLVYLFTDQNFRNELFGRGTSAPPSTKVTYTLSDILTATNPTANITNLA